VVRKTWHAWPARFSSACCAGRTGSGKTRLLQALAAAGAQVLDLEALAAHRGSILGGLPGQPQPTQKPSTTACGRRCGRSTPAGRCIVESESPKIGTLRVPDALIGTCMPRARCCGCRCPTRRTVQLLLEDYGFFAQDADRFCRCWMAWSNCVAATPWALAGTGPRGCLADVIGAMMTDHYDPLYERSMDRQLRRPAQARPVLLPDGGPAALAAIPGKLAIMAGRLTDTTPMECATSSALAESRASWRAPHPFAAPAGLAGAGLA
jgi:tRNA 2-selenouridine synthase